MNALKLVAEAGVRMPSQRSTQVGPKGCSVGSLVVSGSTKVAKLVALAGGDDVEVGADALHSDRS